MFPTNTQEVVTSPRAALAWHIALETATDRALFAYPAEHKRILAARSLMDKGGVRVQGKYITVPSQTEPGKVYDVTETCACSWFTYGAREGQRRRCAHRWAYLLYSHAMERFLSMFYAEYITFDAQGTSHRIEGYAQALPEDSGHLFFHALDGSHRFIPAPSSHLTLLGKLAWLDETGALCGAIPQALLDLQPK